MGLEERVVNSLSLSMKKNHWQLVPAIVGLSQFPLTVQLTLTPQAVPETVPDVVQVRELAELVFPEPEAVTLNLRLPEQAPATVRSPV